MNYVREYWERISSGEIVTSKRVKAVYGRLVAEMDAADESSPYYFDEAVGERPIIFVERFCKQSQGTLGESLTLELFQKAFIQLLFGWLERATGYRRFRETLFLVGRKNGKSTLLAALALYMLVADYEGAAEIYSVATKKDQAKKTLTEAVNMVKQSPELSAILKKRRNDIYFPATASKFEALASDSNTLDGLNSHAVIIDELHAIRDRNLYEVMKQSTSSRRQPLVIMITTSGTVRESVFDNLYGYACEVADGQTPDERFLPVLYELDKREEWTDPTAWIKANPGLGTIKQYTTLADFVERAKKNPEDLPGVLCKDFNVKATGAASWLSYEDAVNEAMREWVSRVDDTLYVLGSVMGPHPYPMIVRDFQSVIGREARQQILEKEGRLPDAVLACVGGGSNAMGIFHEFIPDEGVQLIGCEAAGKGVDTAMNAATMTCGSEGVFHGMKSYFCQNEFGQIAPVYSISAGLDYPGVGPEHAYLHDIGRAQYVPVTDDQAVDAFEYIARTEGIICAIESAHAVAYAMELAPKMDKDQIMIVNLSGRGDKDVAAIARYRGIDLHE